MNTGTKSVAPHSGIVERLAAAAEIEWSYREDDCYPPRDFWHARLTWAGYSSDWTRFGEQEKRKLPVAVKRDVEAELRADFKRAIATVIARLTSPVEGVELVERLRNLRACEPGCEGRCDFCPDEVGREAADLIATLNAALAAEKARADELERSKREWKAKVEETIIRAQDAEAARVKAEGALRDARAELLDEEDVRPHPGIQMNNAIALIDAALGETP